MNDITNIEKYLSENKTLTYTFKGVSMNPLLKQGRDLFTVEAKTENRCKKNDVVLFRNPFGKLVLHRVVAVNSKDYVTMGDNCEKKEYGIKDDDIIGVMTSFCRKGKVIQVNDFRYRFYCIALSIVHPVINFFKSIKRRIKRNV